MPHGMLKVEFVHGDRVFEGQFSSEDFACPREAMNGCLSKMMDKAGKELPFPCSPPFPQRVRVEVVEVGSLDEAFAAIKRDLFGAPPQSQKPYKNPAEQADTNDC